MLQIFDSPAKYADQLKALGSLGESYSFHDTLMAVAAAQRLYPKVPASYWVEVLGVLATDVKVR